MAETENNFQTFEIDIDDLSESLINNVKKDTKTFEDVVNLQGASNREFYISDIEDGVGSSIDGCIRFWNDYDNKHNIPVEERKPIKLYIDSCGGSLLDTFTIIDSIKMSKTPVWTIVTGAAYSGGFFITIAGHKRFAYPHSSFLFHEGSTSTGGTSSQFENYSVFYKRQLSQLGEHTLNCTKITKEQYEEKKREDWWIDANEAIKLGIIDEISEELI